MTAREPENLRLLGAAFGEDTMGKLFSGDSLVVDGVEFVSGYEPDSSADRFYIVKPLHLIDRYRELSERASGGNIVELGIAEGGSAALLALWADPARLVTLDNEPERLVALDRFIEARGLSDRLRPFYGVDQADRARLTEIVEQEFAGAQLDLVIDDASPAYAPTRASFETLFPYVKPGGLYIIEDWEADIAMADSVRKILADPDSPQYLAAKKSVSAALRGRGDATSAPRTSLARLALELVVLAGGQSGLVSDLSINKSFVAVTRGEGPAVPGELRLDEFGVHGHNLLVPPPA